MQKVLHFEEMFLQPKHFLRSMLKQILLLQKSFAVFSKMQKNHQRIIQIWDLNPDSNLVLTLWRGFAAVPKITFAFP